MLGAKMAENSTPNRGNNEDDDEETPLVTPFHDSLPPPPDISYTRPTLGQKRPAVRSAFSSQDNGQNQLSSGVQGYGLAITAAITLAVTLLIFVAIGQWLDHRYNASGTPWFTIAGLLIGIAGGFFSMIRLLSTSGRQ